MQYSELVGCSVAWASPCMFACWVLLRRFSIQPQTLCRAALPDGACCRHTKSTLPLLLNVSPCCPSNLSGLYSVTQVELIHGRQQGSSGIVQQLMPGCSPHARLL